MGGGDGRRERTLILVYTVITDQLSASPSKHHFIRCHATVQSKHLLFVHHVNGHLQIRLVVRDTEGAAHLVHILLFHSQQRPDHSLLCFCSPLVAVHDSEQCHRMEGDSDTVHVLHAVNSTCVAGACIHTLNLRVWIHSYM